MTADVLVFIEDPGAANFIVPIVEALEARGIRVALRTDGTAASYVQRPSIPRDETAEQLISRVKPRAVLVGTSESADTLGLSLIDAAKRAHIPTAGAVDALGNAAGRFRGLGENPLRHAPDVILVADATTANAFAELGYATDAIRICGHPQHDTVLARAAMLDREGRAAVRSRALPHAPLEGRVVVFASEVSTGVGEDVFRRDDTYTLRGSGHHHLRTEIVLEEFLAAAATLPSKPYLVLRLHPKNTPKELAPFMAAFDHVSAGGPGLEAVYAADAVVGMTSMLLVEGMLIGRPVLSILPRAIERNLVSELQAGLIPIATTAAEIRGALPRLLEPAAPESGGDRPAKGGAAAAAADVIANLLR